MKRFYNTATVEKIDIGYGVMLDGKPVRLPSGGLLSVSSAAAAELVMQEWAVQADTIIPSSMPVNQLVVTYLDSVDNRENRLASILEYADTDLLFYRAAHAPYKEQQAENWQPWIEWFENRFSVAVSTTENLSGIRQDEAVHDALAAYAGTLADFPLYLFEILLRETSSYILSIAFFSGAASVDAIFAAIFLEDMIRAEIYDEDRYGAAPDQIRKRDSTRQLLTAIKNLLAAG